MYLPGFHYWGSLAMGQRVHIKLEAYRPIDPHIFFFLRVFLVISFLLLLG